MWSRRIERVNELLLREISRIVTERQDPDIGFVTFTGVKITEDLMQARVFYSVLGSEEERAQTAGALLRMRHDLRRSMRRLESLRRIPELEFVYDGTPARAARVFELLEQIHHEEQNISAASPAPGETAETQGAPAVSDGDPSRKREKRSLPACPDRCLKEGQPLPLEKPMGRKGRQKEPTRAQRTHRKKTG